MIQPVKHEAVVYFKVLFSHFLFLFLQNQIHTDIKKSSQKKVIKDKIYDWFVKPANAADTIKINIDCKNDVSKRIAT